MRSSRQPTAGLHPACCFERIFGTHATIRQLVLSHVTKEEADILRRVSRAVRAAVNRNVTTVKCELAAPRFETELATVFSDANRLRVEMETVSFTDVDVCFLLEYMLATTPALVSKLQSLTLTLGAINSFEEVMGAVAGFLSRCSSLQEMEVAWLEDNEYEHRNSVAFKGAGSTPQEQHASMQRQLAALCSSTDFLAPASWPTHSCLTSLTVHRASIQAQEDFLIAATRTTSLAHLVVQADDDSTSAPLRSLSDLQRLTHLKLGCDESDFAPLDDGMEDSIAQLCGLQQLHLDLDLLDEKGDELGGAIPASWSSLTSLTQVHLNVTLSDTARCLLLAPLTHLVAVKHLSMDCATCLGGVSSLFALTCLTRLEAYVQLDDVDGGEGGGSRQLVVPQQWRDGLLSLGWGDDSPGSIAMLSQLTSLTYLDLCAVRVMPQLCRALGKLVHLTQLRVAALNAPQEPHHNPDWAKFCPLLPSLRALHVRHCTDNLLAPLHALARWTRLPPGTAVTLEHSGLPQVLHLAVKGWGRGWLAAVLAGEHACEGYSFAVVAVDDSDVDHYLSSVAGMAPGQQRGCSHVVWLGEQVTPACFSRLVSCTAQPPLRLESGTAAQSAQLEPFVLQWAACLTLTPGHVRALAAVAAPRLVSLVVGDCRQLTNRDVAVLAGACHALQEITLTNAPKLTDLALHSLAGCRQLERVQLTHTGVTEGGVAVMLVTLRGLRELLLGSVPPIHNPASLGLRVQQELEAAEQQQWVVDQPDGILKPCIAWRRRPGVRG